MFLLILDPALLSVSDFRFAYGKRHLRNWAQKPIHNLLTVFVLKLGPGEKNTYILNPTHLCMNHHYLQ